jgi:hypothetical protein
MEQDTKKQRIYLNIGKNSEDKVLDYNFLKPLIDYFEKKGWKFQLRFDDFSDCKAYFEKETKK